MQAIVLRGRVLFGDFYCVFRIIHINVSVLIVITNKKMKKLFNRFLAPVY